MAEQICLKWNSFHSNILTNFKSLWEEEGLVDVTLASDGQCIRAHKIILSACSPFFKTIFQSNPCQHPVIILQDVRFTEVESLLSFVYKGEVNIQSENLPALLRAAETLQIRGLSGASEQVKQKMAISKASSAEKCRDDGLPPAKRRRDVTSRSPPPPSTPSAATPTSHSPRVRHNSHNYAEPSDGIPRKMEPIDSEPSSPITPAICMDESLDESNDESMELMAKHSVLDVDQLNVAENPPYPPFPCPFCERAYTSWGFRRRHIKAMHTQSPRLSCKWCLRVLPSHDDWSHHVAAEHSLSLEDAHKGLLILEEAHMVLQIPKPTRLDTLVTMINQSTSRDVT